MKKTFSILLRTALILFSISAFAQSVIPPKNGNVNLPSNGSTDRVELPSLTVGTCSFVAPASNTDNIYFGGSTVTNASGTNKGITLGPGFGIFNVSMTNLAAAFFSTDTNDNKVQWICN